MAEKEQTFLQQAPVLLSKAQAGAIRNESFPAALVLLQQLLRQMLDRCLDKSLQQLSIQPMQALGG